MDGTRAQYNDLIDDGSRGSMDGGWHSDDLIYVGEAKNADGSPMVKVSVYRPDYAKIAARRIAEIHDNIKRRKEREAKASGSILP
jgi:hypothetical protein